MNTISKDSLIKLIVTGVAAFFMLLGVIFNIVIKADGWTWATSVILLFAPLALLVFAILEIAMPNVIKPIYYLSIFAIMILSKFILSIEELVNMGEYKYARATYFSNFILTLVMIAAMVIAIISSIKYKTMFVPFVVSITYITFGYFNGIIGNFFLFWGNLFGGNKVRYSFRSFSINVAMFLTIATVVYMVYKINKDELSK